MYNDRKIRKVEVKYQSDFEYYINRIKIFILSILKPFIAISILLIGLYISFYVIGVFILFFLSKDYRQSLNRIINYKVEFKPPTPFYLENISKK